MKVALVVGHNKGTGAQSITGVDEWSWNSIIAKKLKVVLDNNGIESIIYERDRSLGYTAAMKEHARNIKKDECTHGLALHFNYHYKNSPANGFEFLYWWASKLSRNMAQVFTKNFGRYFDMIKPRKGKWFSGWTAGAKMLWLRSWNKSKADSRRGAEICFYTHCPFIICEPGFASNAHEWAVLENETSRIALAYAEALIELSKS
ncbi:MAG: N-acetylmuramoyl-L-alanine amidase [Akkermansiaceae bacterium]